MQSFKKVIPMVVLSTMLMPGCGDKKSIDTQVKVESNTELQKEEKMRPNILLITADDMNYNAPGFMGGKVEGITPNLDKLASEGMVFKNAHVTVALCQPSREAMMTGRYPHRSGALGFDPIRPDVPTLQEMLKHVGYMNGIIGKENQLMPKEKFCWDTFIRMMTDENGQGRDPQKYYEYCKNFFETAQKEGKPFFLMANSHDPHRPFAGSQQEKKNFGYNVKVRRQYKPEEIIIPGCLPDIPGVRQEVSEYYTSVHRCDETVGEILRALREVGMEENTIVMFLSDNGMSLPFAKSNCYLNSTKTPWIVKWPEKVQPGTVDDQNMINGVDYMPTILEAIGMPNIKDVDGKSFLPLLMGESQEGREYTFTFINTLVGKKSYPMRAIQSRDFGYIYNQWSDQQYKFKNEAMTGLSFDAMQAAAANDEAIAERVNLYLYRVKEEFYNFKEDPDGLNNLIDDPKYNDIIDTMRKELYKTMSETKDHLTGEFKKEVMDTLQ